MPEGTLRRSPGITVEAVRSAMDLVTYAHPGRVERPEPVCAWSRLCGDEFCRFPRYSRGGGPVGLTASILVKLGFPLDVLKELDCEYEVGEVLHPGVKIGRTRNAAIARIDPAGLALLAHLQEQQKLGLSWSQITMDAVRPRRMVKYFDQRRRPWLY